MTFTLTERTERSFVLRRDLYLVEWQDGFQFHDRDGGIWRPSRQRYYSDGASVPHPFDWLIPPLAPFAYRYATMGIHDPAYRHGVLDRWDSERGEWRTVRVCKSRADALLAQAVEAEGGWASTQCVFRFFTGMGHLWR